MASTSTVPTSKGNGNGSRLHPSASTGLPTHTSHSMSPTDERRRRRRRCCCICLLVTLGVLLLLGVTLLVLFLTVLRIRDPTTRLVSTRLIGVAPSLKPPVQLNVTLLLTVAVHNPNRASFYYESGHTDLWYRGSHIGDGEVDPGCIPSKGDSTVQMVMTVLSDSLAADMTQLIKDFEAGSVPLDASARIPGRVSVFRGVFKLHAVAYSDCHVVLGVPEMSIRSQECRDHTKL